MQIFDLSLSELTKKAEELHFVRDTLEKVLRLTEILTYIHSNSRMKDTLALKGGTAINLTVFNLPRLSVDIDLDYHADQTRTEMMTTRKEITKDLPTYRESQGYTRHTGSKSWHSLDSFVFSYTH